MQKHKVFTDVWLSPSLMNKYKYGVSRLNSKKTASIVVCRCRTKRDAGIIAKA